MFTAYIIVTVLTAAANAFAAIVDFRRPQWVLDNISKWGGSHSWLFPLGALKGAGALGLLVGVGVPLIGIAAAVGSGLVFCRCHYGCNPCSLVLTPSLAGDVSLAGCSIAGITADGVVSERWIGFS
jgi:hypothetical protein